MNKILKKSVAAVYQPDTYIWDSSSVFFETEKKTTYEDTVKDCRFFYRTDPIASTVINKLVEIGITELEIDSSELNPNEHRIYTVYKDKIQSFIQHCALEYLISGLVIPEIVFEPVDRDELKLLGIKKYSQLYLPTSMWLRNSEHVVIKNLFLGDDKPAFFIKVPQELVNLITYQNEERLKWLEENYPEFIQAVRSGKTILPLKNDLIIRRLYLPDSPYPIPYLFAALESLKHKRNLRMMDYAIAGRVIRAIQHIKVGTDEFPLLEGEESVFDELRAQLKQSNYSPKQVESIIQLFTNHTVNIEWVIPDARDLISTAKYEEVDNDIFFALGFPRILATGETLRTQTSNHELATQSPIKTMEKMQNDLLPIVKYIMLKIKQLNGLVNLPEVRFKKINFYSFVSFVEGLFKLYEIGGISTETLSKYFGIDYSDEIKIIEREKIFQNLPQ